MGFADGSQGCQLLPPLGAAQLPADAALAVAVGRRLRGGGGAGRRGQLAATWKTAGTTSCPLPALTADLRGGSSSSAAVGAFSLLQPGGEASDTVQMWRNYRKQASAHQDHMARGPRWRSEARYTEVATKAEEASPTPYLPSWAADAQSAHAKSRRDLRKQLREAKDFIEMGDKRGFVHGLVASEDVPQLLASETRKMANSTHRIEGAIRDCARRRQELVTMQQKMASVVFVSDPGEVKKKKAGLGLREALGNFPSRPKAA